MNESINRSMNELILSAIKHKYPTINSQLIDKINSTLFYSTDFDEESDYTPRQISHYIINNKCINELIYQRLNSTTIIGLSKKSLQIDESKLRSLNEYQDNPWAELITITDELQEQIYINAKRLLSKFVEHYTYFIRDVENIYSELTDYNIHDIKEQITKLYNNRIENIDKYIPTEIQPSIRFTISSIQDAEKVLDQLKIYTSSKSFETAEWIVQPIKASDSLSYYAELWSIKLV